MTESSVTSSTCGTSASGNPAESIDCNSVDAELWHRLLNLTELIHGERCEYGDEPSGPREGHPYVELPMGCTRHQRRERRQSLGSPADCWQIPGATTGSWYKGTKIVDANVSGKIEWERHRLGSLGVRRGQADEGESPREAVGEDQHDRQACRCRRRTHREVESRLGIQRR